MSTHPLNRIRAVAGALLIAAAVALSACSAVESVADIQPGPSEARPATEVASAPQDPRARIAAAVRTAHYQGKRVLIYFGAEWWPSCRELNTFYDDPAVEQRMTADYVLVGVDVGDFDQNMDVSDEYGGAASAGIPALVVLDDRGDMVATTASGNTFIEKDKMLAQDFAAFLTQWAG